MSAPETLGLLSPAEEEIRIDGRRLEGSLVRRWQDGIGNMMRPFAWRLGRFLYRWARREGANRPADNGEHWLLEQVVRGTDAGTVVLLDVGANRGEWSAAALHALARHRRPGRIHAFEPVGATFEYLCRRFQGEASLCPHHLALSDRSGESEIYVVGPLSGRNSLYPVEDGRLERVQLESLDGFVAASGVSRISMVKSDTEGHDLTVLRGGREALHAGRVDVWQFEYNHRWLVDGASLLAVFDLIDGLPYRLGKLYGDGIELYDRWHFELDRFIETNYVLVRTGTAYERLGHTVRFDDRNVARRASR